MKNNLRVILAKQRKKLANVAEGTGLAKSTLTAIYYERAKKPSVDTFQKIADFLGVTVDELLNTED
ncbi:helix-turn-helix transcriptional regulator [Streptococcus suis]|uniref:helix-turn-helix domain-containing protein n=1 Tax=Streptococcus suis TaxID=1307 RepID=UPI0005CCFAF1|nr:helix-turn-helix transcriptional regulator [Streptococcus suis]MCK4004404.1 helix-turn-helix transcriptional regulator [Streptococcus suis]NQG46696.1 helix-turn-helix transcriptional regulator [Streptococcus suis]NQJ90274.1 helix-turn-helix transcriptional regulator [Streptococcus suis]NQL58085.1 helix-turn-helix transcriptional regulator [Streptococcus suis]NQL92219.1 helix-turn-helix transcriptional regulator [Streptococcus suis]